MQETISGRFSISTSASGSSCSAFLSFFYSSSAAIESLTAFLQARWQSSVRSAPEKSLVIVAKNFIEMLGATELFLKQAFKIPSLAGSSGRGM